MSAEGEHKEPIEPKEEQPDAQLEEHSPVQQTVPEPEEQPDKGSDDGAKEDDEEPPVEKKKPKKKSVGFAPPPEEDLREHHKIIKEKEEMRAKSNPFHRIPPELAYLEKRDKSIDPKPLKQSAPAAPARTSKPTNPANSYLPPLSKLKFFDIKHLSVQNSETELQFQYSQINLPPSSDTIIVDVKYGGLNSIDVAKIHRYRLNLSNVKVGLGYEFSGVVTNVGSSYKSKFVEGDVVYGLIELSSRRGALSSSQIIYPSRDVVIKIDQDKLDRLDEVDIDLTNLGTNEEFEVGEDEDEATTEDGVDNTSKTSSTEPKDVPVLAKLCSFPLLYNCAKQLLKNLKIRNNLANILINGGDTNIGLTIIQLLLGSYNLDYLNLIIIVRERTQEHMEKLMGQLQEKFKDPATVKRVRCIAFDSVNNDLIFPGEYIPIAYKKKDFFASEVIDALLVPQYAHEKIDEKNINNYKLDMIIDLVGCRKYFETSSTKINTFDSINMPFKDHIACPVGKLFNGNVKEPFLKRILKPKSSGSCLVSGCNYYLDEPCYDAHRFIEGSALWTSSWLGNYWSSYNYYDNIVWGQLWKKDRTEEALQLVLEGKLRFKVDEFTDWKNYKRNDVKDKDAKIIVKVEDF
ncbi:Protein AST1 [Candida viswanathii]|uniref:Protein AST1 n=1 Tax=Candida viswanathii TaxID=5486 RepID=A0A367XVZ1_9ASCO|nr:Protein AST1 [Candida viswanathii]